MITQALGNDLVERTQRTFGVVLLTTFPFVLFYAGVWEGISYFSGGIWGLVNLLFIAFLVRATIKTGEIQTRSALLLVLVKFPLLYLAGYFLLTVERFSPLYLVAGFTSLFAIIVLKVAARMIFGMDSKNTGTTPLSGVVS